MTLEKLLENWNSTATEEYVLCRGIDLWKWRCYAQVAGVVDGRKWKGAEVARERKLSRARICVVLKEVKRKLAEGQEPNPRRKFFCRLRKFDLRHAVSVRKAFGLDGGSKPEFNWRCYPDVVNSVFIAEGWEWVCDEVIGWKSVEHGLVFSLQCSRAGVDNPPRRILQAPPAFNVHPIVVDCGGRWFVLDRFESAARIDRILLKPLA